MVEIVNKCYWSLLLVLKCGLNADSKEAEKNRQNYYLKIHLQLLQKYESFLAFMSHAIITSHPL